MIVVGLVQRMDGRVRVVAEDASAGHESDFLTIPVSVLTGGEVHVKLGDTVYLDRDRQHLLWTPMEMVGHEQLQTRGYEWNVPIRIMRG